MNNKPEEKDKNKPVETTTSLLHRNLTNPSDTNFLSDSMKEKLKNLKDGDII